MPIFAKTLYLALPSFDVQGQPTAAKSMKILDSGHLYRIQSIKRRHLAGRRALVAPVPSKASKGLLAAMKH